MSNPAKRLHSLITQAKGKDANQPAYVVWSDVLQIKRDDTAIFWSQMAKVMELPLAIQEKIQRQSKVAPKIALRWVPKINDAFKAMSPQGHFHNFITHIDDTTLYSLEICSDILESTEPELEYDEESLKSIQSKINTLSEEIIKATIDQDIKRYILSLLSRLAWAIREYRIAGPTPLRSALESVLGSIAIDPDTYLKSKKTDSGKRAWELIRNLATVVQIGVGIVTIADKIVHALPAHQNVTIEAEMVPEKLP